MAHAIGHFEEQFTYPLGRDGRFVIEHGGDGWRFFAALGEAIYVVSESSQHVQGVLGAALRQVIDPSGAVVSMLYLGDLKIAPEERGGMVLCRLVRALQQHYRGRLHAGFAVVMDGTAVTPMSYTGRLGIPQFTPADTVAILWLQTRGSSGVPSVPGSLPIDIHLCDENRGLSVFSKLAVGCYQLSSGQPKERSVMAPQWLTADDECAVGRVEDTLRAKRLRATTGEDMRSAHLSCFAYRRIADGLKLLLAALDLAAGHGYAMLFVSVSMADAATIQAGLGTRVRSLSTATIYGANFRINSPWNINTAEI